MAPKDRHLWQFLADWFSGPVAREKAAKVEELEKLLEGFDAREREAVEYLRWIKNKALAAYADRMRIENRQSNPSLEGVQTALESFIEFLNGYRHLKHYMRSVNRKHVETEIEKEEEKSRSNDPTYNVTHLASMRKQFLAFDDVQRKVLLIEGQLKMIEGFFELMNGQTALMRSGGSSKNFEALLERDLPAVLSETSLR